MAMTSEIFNTAKNIAQHIQERNFDKIQVVSHIDADGLTAAGIATIALDREGINSEVKFIKQIDSGVIDDLNAFSRDANNGKSVFWFTDLGSGMNKQIHHLKPIITDHHAPSILDYNVPKQARIDLLQFGEVLDDQKEELHLNPHLFNIDGTYEISGAGTVYLVARELNEKNKDLAYLAIIGAVGDLQDTRYHQLVGVNKKILNDAVVSKKIEVQFDISTFGRETRPIQTILQYSTDPYFPGLTMNEANCVKFLNNLEIPLKANGRARHWVDLAFDEKKKILSELMELMLSKGIGHKDAKRLFSEVYLLPAESRSTPLHDAKEFATLLNSCGKYDHPEVGFSICLGNRKEQLNKALGLLRGHKSMIMESMQYVRELGIEDFGSIQYFNAKDKIPDNIIGTIASMMLNNNQVDQNKVVIGFALTEDGKSLKASARATRKLVKQGLNLSKVMSQVTAGFGEGSVGGGHDIAAGATIPLDKQVEFLELAEKIVSAQLKKDL